MAKKVARRTRIKHPVSKDEGDAAPEDPPTNQAPVIPPIEPQQAHPTIELIFTVVAYDPEGDPMTFELVGGPATAFIDTTTGEFTWTPAWADLGSRYITVRVTDDHGNETEASFRVDVENEAPEIAALGPETVHPGDELTFSVAAFDPDGDPITYSLVNPPAGASISANDGIFNWTPGWADLGSQYINVRACDPEPQCTTEPCLVNVVNAAPQVASVADHDTDVNTELCIMISAFDPDGDQITYSLVQAPTGAAIDGAGNFCWTPTAQQAGVHFVTVRVCDPEPLCGQVTFKITVNP